MYHVYTITIYISVNNVPFSSMYAGTYLTFFKCISSILSTIGKMQHLVLMGEGVRGERGRGIGRGREVRGREKERGREGSRDGWETYGEGGMGRRKA